MIVFRVPSDSPRCYRRHCAEPPVADMRRRDHLNTGRPQWWAYCAIHLRSYDREVRDGRVVPITPDPHAGDVW